MEIGSIPTMRPQAISVGIIAILLASTSYLEFSHGEKPLPPSIPVVTSCPELRQGMEETTAGSRKGVVCGIATGAAKRGAAGASTGIGKSNHRGTAEEWSEPDGCGRL
jgi:hypothetical protein